MAKWYAVTNVTQGPIKVRCVYQHTSTEVARINAVCKTHPAAKVFACDTRKEARDRVVRPWAYESADGRPHTPPLPLPLVVPEDDPLDIENAEVPADEPTPVPTPVARGHIPGFMEGLEVTARMTRTLTPDLDAEWQRVYGLTPHDLDTIDRILDATSDARVPIDTTDTRGQPFKRGTHDGLAGLVGGIMYMRMRVSKGPPDEMVEPYHCDSNGNPAPYRCLGLKPAKDAIEKRIALREQARREDRRPWPGSSDGPDGPPTEPTS